MTASTANGVNFAFVDGKADSREIAPGVGIASPAPLGHYLELYEDHPGIRDFYAMVEGAAKGWNGEAPLRSI